MFVKNLNLKFYENNSRGRLPDREGLTNILTEVNSRFQIFESVCKGRDFDIKCTYPKTAELLHNNSYYCCLGRLILIL